MHRAIHNINGKSVEMMMGETMREENEENIQGGRFNLSRIRCLEILLDTVVLKPAHVAAYLERATEQKPLRILNAHGASTPKTWTYEDATGEVGNVKDLIENSPSSAGWIVMCCNRGEYKLDTPLSVLYPRGIASSLSLSKGSVVMKATQSERGAVEIALESLEKITCELTERMNKEARRLLIEIPDEVVNEAKRTYIERREQLIRNYGE